RIVVKDLLDRGGIGYAYRVDVEPTGSALRLAFEDEQINIPSAGTALTPLPVARAGYEGANAMVISDLPADDGVTAMRGTVPAGQSVSVVGLRASPGSTFDVRELQVVVEGDDGRSVVATKAIVFAEQQATGSGFGQSG